MHKVKFPINEDQLPEVGDTEAASRGFERWRECAGEQQDSGLVRYMNELPGNLKAKALLACVFGNSPFLTHCVITDPGFMRDVLEIGPEDTFSRLMAEIRNLTLKETDITVPMRSLRIAKRRVALLVALADIAGLWPLEAVTEALSDFAEAATRTALRFLLWREHHKGNLVLPHPADPEKGCGVIVLGMGKFGARELNYSSDIDLIVFYDHEKIDYRGKRSLPECMIALTKDLVRILDERTADGYVFRTDLRLRPDPGAMPVAVSIVAAEAYYEGFGQNWERAAMIKARQVAGDHDTGTDFLKFLAPFIWRKSLDFAAIRDIHSIKRQINAFRGGRTIAVAGHNIKLGRGGIREIEFFAQTQQLIWGGRQPRLRLPRTLDALHALVQEDHVRPETAGQLEEAYRFLRRLEHRLQMIDDQQTQTLPDNPERLAGLAAFMGFADVAAFSGALTQHLQSVETHYAALFEDSPSLSAHGNLVFTGGENDPDTVRTLNEMGFVNADAVCATIRGWHHGRIRATRSTRARELLTELTPTLLESMAATAAPDDAFMRFDDFLSRLPAGIPLFSLFYSNPPLLGLVAEIMGNAPALASHLANHTILLDSVVSASFFAPPPDLDALCTELGEILDATSDFQEFLDAGRRWTNDRKFQIGVQSLRGLLTPEQSAHAFTDVADTVLREFPPRLAADFAHNHGLIDGGAWCILAMGKMGGREMTATSDMDLILIYDCPSGTEESTGPRPLAPPVWFARFTQRVVNALTAKTAEGALYEVDLRLRPSGNSGPVATSLDSFDRYQRETAWTWEHQALTRARVVAGDRDLALRVEAIRQAVLTVRRDPDRLVIDVVDMRARMLRTHPPTTRWEVKHLRGGLVDIEFIAQFLQLRHGADHPAMLATNTRQALENAAQAGVLDRPDLDVLVTAWRLWSAVQLVLRQTVAGAFDETSAPRGLKDVLVQAAGLTDFRTLTDHMDDLALAATEIYRRLLEEPANAARQRLARPNAE